MVLGWYYQFIGKHPKLSLRIMKFIKRSKNKVILEGLWFLIFELIHNVIEQGIEENMLWNMDKTGFSQKKKSHKVIASKGSNNVWSNSTKDNFQTTFVVCVSAECTVAPPLLCVPGKCLNIYVP